MWRPPENTRVYGYLCTSYILISVVLYTHILEDYSGYVTQTSITKSSHFTVCTDTGLKRYIYCESIYEHLELRGVAFW